MLSDTQVACAAAKTSALLSSRAPRWAAHVVLLDYIAQVVIEQSVDIFGNRHATLFGKVIERSAGGFMDANRQHGSAGELGRQSVGIRTGMATKKVQ
jgi:hypothetical protein